MPIPSRETTVAVPGVVGRDAELTRLARLLSRAGLGSAAVAVILGETGCGKTHLLNGTDRIFNGRDGLEVMRLQSGLLAVGLSVGPAGTDGIFGSDTGAAVTAFKIRKGLVPSDPVVGRGTTQALDDELFFDPPGSTRYSASSAPQLLIIYSSSSSLAS